MATIKPFRGYLYNREKIENLELVVAPPYDVINSEQQSKYYQKHPLNIIRLILGKEESGDDERNNRYTRAAHFLSTWQKDSVLKRIPGPAIYFYVQDFLLPSGESRRRKGFICLFKLEEFSSGIILPHERTLSKPKTDRLNLTLACRANFNPVFSLYSDPGAQVESHIDAEGKKAPYLDVTDENNVRHQMWVVDDVKVINHVQEVMKNKSILIADGHHRYETALNYRNKLKEKFPGSTGNEPFYYTLMYCSNMDDAGLVILPTHRLLKNINFDPAQFFQKAQKYFEIETLPVTPKTESGVRQKMLAAMNNEAKERYLFGMVAKGQDKYFLLRLKDFNLLGGLVDKPTSKALLHLDASILEFLVFNTLLGLSFSDPKFEEKIKFVHTEDEAVNLVKSGEYDVSFIVNPTRIEQVRDVVAEGEIMPQKSTYFFPKLLSGLVINTINPEEKVE